MQTQRLIGQQSLGGKFIVNYDLSKYFFIEFMGLSVDLEKVFYDNMKKTVFKNFV